MGPKGEDGLPRAWPEERSREAPLSLSPTNTCQNPIKTAGGTAHPVLWGKQGTRLSMGVIQPFSPPERLFLPRSSVSPISPCPQRSTQGFHPALCHPGVPT